MIEPYNLNHAEWKKVLLVDDDPDDLALLEEALKTSDREHQIIAAHDGLEGLVRLVQAKMADPLSKPMA